MEGCLDTKSSQGRGGVCGRAKSSKRKEESKGSQKRMKVDDEFQWGEAGSSQEVARSAFLYM